MPFRNSFFFTSTANTGINLSLLQLRMNYWRWGCLTIIICQATRKHHGVSLIKIRSRLITMMATLCQGIPHRQAKALTLNRSSSMTLHNQQFESGGPGKGQDILPLLSGRCVQMCQCLVKVWKCLVHMFCGEMQLNHRPFQHTKDLTGHLCS